MQKMLLALNENSQNTLLTLLPLQQADSKWHSHMQQRVSRPDTENPECNKTTPPPNSPQTHRK